MLVQEKGINWYSPQTGYIRILNGEYHNHKGIVRVLPKDAVELPNEQIKEIKDQMWEDRKALMEIIRQILEGELLSELNGYPFELSAVEISIPNKFFGEDKNVKVVFKFRYGKTSIGGNITNFYCTGKLFQVLDSSDIDNFLKVKHKSFSSLKEDKTLEARLLTVLQEKLENLDNEALRKALYTLKVLDNNRCILNYTK